MAVTLKIKGLAELRIRLAQMPIAAARRISRDALVEAAAPIVDAARRLVPVKSGRLRDAITVSATHKRGTNYLVHVGVFSQRAYYSRFIEYGVPAAHETTKKKQVPRKKVLADPATRVVFGKRVTIPPRAPRPFLRPAVDEHWEESTRLLGELIYQALEAEAKR